MHFKYFLRLAVLLSLAACEFQPSEIPEIEIKEPSENSRYSIGTETNVLILFQNVKISYQFQTESNKIHWVEFYIDDWQNATKPCKHVRLKRFQLQRKLKRDRLCK